MAENSTSGIAEPVEQTAVQPRVDKKKKPKRQPRYNVILWNDEDHTHEYVVAMMQKLFGHPAVKGDADRPRSRQSGPGDRTHDHSGTCRAEA